MGVLLRLPEYFRSDNSRYLMCTQEEAPNDCSQPLIIYSRDVWHEGTSFTIWAEGQHLASALDAIHAYELLFVAHFILNMTYAKKARNTLTLLQRCVMVMTEKQCLQQFRLL